MAGYYSEIEWNIGIQRERIRMFQDAFRGAFCKNEEPSDVNKLTIYNWGNIKIKDLFQPAKGLNRIYFTMEEK